VTDQAPQVVQYAPLEYHFAKAHDRLAVQIANPTDDRIILVGERSSVVDPAGQIRPIQSQVLEPRSFARMLLPPRPVSIAVPNYYAWGWGWGPYWGPTYWGPYNPYWGPYYGWYGPPPVSYWRVRTPFDWRWTTGLARLRLTYDRKGTMIEHYFEIVREEK
jgi:hypothetical protein